MFRVLPNTIFSSFFVLATCGLVYPESAATVDVSVRTAQSNRDHSLTSTRTDGRLLRAARTEGRPCRKLLWFTALYALNEEYIQYLQVAVLSARRHAPSLIPVLVFDGEPTHPIVDWMERNGAIVICRRLSFLKDLIRVELEGKLPAGGAEFRRGTYLRLDVPQIFTELTAGLQDGGQVNLDFYLYTDTDVMFLEDANDCSFAAPEVMSMGAQFYRGEIENAGVMFANAHAMANHTPGLLAYANKHGWNFTFDDQGLLLEYFEGKIGLLPDRFNWKGYWGQPEGEPPPVIFHFHGPKPDRCLSCYLSSPATFEVDCPDDPGCHEVYLLILSEANDDPTVAPLYRKAVDLYYSLVREAEGMAAVESERHVEL